MTVRLKFRVTEKAERAPYQPGARPNGIVKLAPVTSGSEENKAFYDATPSGQIEFATVNKDALDALPLGAEVYVDLTVVVPAPPATS